jgi:hypothetical protein
MDAKLEKNMHQKWIIVFAVAFALFNVIHQSLSNGKDGFINSITPILFAMIFITLAIPAQKIEARLKSGPMKNNQSVATVISVTIVIFVSILVFSILALPFIFKL